MIKSVVANGYYSGAGGGDGYGSIANREAVTIIPFQWPDEGQRLIDS